jgi:hypothetical protein
MDESCPHKFYPPRLFADFASCSSTKWAREIYLNSWFHKRKIAWSHAYRYLLSEDIG